MKKKKSILYFILIVLILITISIICIVNSKEKTVTDQDSIHYNNNENLTADKEVGEILFSNIKCSYDGKISLLSYKITNTSNQTIHLGEYNIIIKDEEGILITEIKLNLDYDLKAGEEFYTTNSINEDLSNAYEMELNIKE